MKFCDIFQHLSTVNYDFGYKQIITDWWKVLKVMFCWKYDRYVCCVTLFLIAITQLQHNRASKQGFPKKSNKCMNFHILRFETLLRKC